MNNKQMMKVGSRSSLDSLLTACNFLQQFNLVFAAFICLES